MNDKLVTVILVDGAFYRKRSAKVFGYKSPKDRADELESYCKRHLNEKIFGQNHSHNLYRIFYYDCEPSKKAVYNPVTKMNDELSKTDNYTWAIEFFNCLKEKRKFALRMGELSDQNAGYYLSPVKTKAILTGKLKIEDVKQSDLSFSMSQKGVDMRIGLDIASLSYKKQVNQIVLISGDSDFVPAAKLARREGIDFVLDPLGVKVKENLLEHIDGLNTKDEAYKNV